MSKGRELLSFIGAGIAVAAAGLFAFGVFAHMGVGGGPLMAWQRRLRLDPMLATPVLAQEAPTESVVMPREGSQWNAMGPDGKMHVYTVSDTSHATTVRGSTGFVICPNGHPVARNANAQDLQEATQCRDGTPLGRNCTAGSITFLCKPGTNPLLRMEVLTPSHEEFQAAQKSGGFLGPRHTESHN
jgi:hypothetical protein